MDIVIQILVSLATSTLVVFLYYLFRRSSSKSKSSDRLSQLERTVFDLQVKVNTLQQYRTPASNNSSNKAHPIQEKENVVVRDGKQKQPKPSDNNDNSQQEEQIEVKPAGAQFTYLSVSEGKLVEVTSGQASYYRAWKHKGRIFFEFFCDPQKVKKAINNRSAIIDPCCVKADSSKEPDNASNIVTIRQGELDNTFKIKTKVTIKYS